MQASNRRTFGIEIELSDLRRANGSGVSSRVINNDYEWIGKGDGSLRGDNTMELESPILRGEDGIQEIMELFEEFDNHNISSEVNDSCGLHTHIGLDDYDTRNLINLWRFTTNIEALLFAMQNEGRWNNQYCVRTRGNPWFATNAATYAACVQGRQCTVSNNLNQLTGNEYFSHSPTRYYGYNMLDYNRRECVEFRLHHGSVDANEIAEWCRFLVTMVDIIKDHDGWIPMLKCPSRRVYALKKQLHYLSEFLTEQGLTQSDVNDILSYIKRRIHQYSGYSANDLTPSSSSLEFLNPEVPWSNIEDLSGGSLNYLSMQNFTTFMYDGTLYCGTRDDVHAKANECINEGLLGRIREAAEEAINEWQGFMPDVAIEQQVDSDAIETGSLVVMNAPNEYESGTFQPGLGVVSFVEGDISIVEFMSSNAGVFVSTPALRVVRSPLRDGEYYVNRDGERSSITAAEESFALYRAAM